MENERFPRPSHRNSKLQSPKNPPQNRQLLAVVLPQPSFCCWRFFPAEKKAAHSSFGNVPLFFLYKPKSPMICCICNRSPSGRLSDTAASRAFCSSLERLPPCAKASPYSRKTSSRSNPVLSLLFSWASLINRSRSSPRASICAFVQPIQSLLLYEDLSGVHNAHEGIQPHLFTLGQAGTNG